MPTEKPRILIVEDEDALRNALKRSLEKEGFDVAEANDGRSAQNLVAFETFCAVLSDIRMPGSTVTGIDLLKFIKAENPMPVILMTGFSELAETKEAFALGADGFLAKPFKKTDLSVLLKKFLPNSAILPENSAADNGKGSSAGETGIAAGNDSDYCRLPVEDFISGRQIKFNIFIRLRKDKFIKIAHQGEDLSSDRVNTFKGKGIFHLYLKQPDFIEYLRFNRVLAQAVKNSTQIDRARKLNVMKHANEVVLDHFYQKELAPNILDEAKSVLQSTIAVVCEQPGGTELLESLNTHSDPLYAHCLGVSFYAALMSNHLKWSSPQTLYTLSLAGLFHDIGKKEIPRDLLDKPRGALSLKEVNLLETHVERGAAILSQLSGISRDTLVIVQQHHERCSGNGYPGKLLKTKIQPLARMIAVCDEFCKLVVSNPQQVKISPVQAIERLFLLESSTLDMTFLEALAEMFGLNASDLRKTLGVSKIAA